jgi:hypothetical protein
MSIMETTFNIKKKIHEYIDHADERILNIFNGIIEAEQGEPSVPESFYQEIEKRKEKHLREESKSFSWIQVKERARATIK